MSDPLTTALLSKRNELEQRLEDGWSKIEELANADTIEKWEGFWINLLKEYEAICDQIAKESAYDV